MYIYIYIYIYIYSEFLTAGLKDTFVMKIFYSIENHFENFGDCK